MFLMALYLAEPGPMPRHLAIFLWLWSIHLLLEPQRHVLLVIGVCNMQNVYDVEDIFCGCGLWFCGCVCV